MKLSNSLLIAIPFVVSGQVSQPQCHEWTQMHLYDTNPAMQPAEDAYVAMVAATLETNCMDANGPKECGLGLGPSNAGNVYAAECTKNGGKMWTYTLHPLCGDISSTSQTEVTGVLVCASASCEDIGVQNLIPNWGFYAPFDEAGYSCGSGTSSLEPVPTETINSQPECQLWTQMHLYDTNQDMQPTEDDYFENVAAFLEANCMVGDEFKGCGKIGVGPGSSSDAYIEECHKNGGHIWRYTTSPLCGEDYSSSSTAGSVSGILVCSSASCESIGVQNLIPPMEIFAPFYEHGLSCGSSTWDLELFSVPSTAV